MLKFDIIIFAGVHRSDWSCWRSISCNSYISSDRLVWKNSLTITRMPPGSWCIIITFSSFVCLITLRYAYIPPHWPKFRDKNENIIVSYIVVYVPNSSILFILKLKYLVAFVIILIELLHLIINLSERILLAIKTVATLARVVIARVGFNFFFFNFFFL